MKVLLTIDLNRIQKLYRSVWEEFFLGAQTPEQVCENLGITPEEFEKAITAMVLFARNDDINKGVKVIG